MGSSERRVWVRSRVYEREFLGGGVGGLSQALDMQGLSRSSWSGECLSSRI